MHKWENPRTDVSVGFWRPYLCPSMESMAGLEIMAGERTMSSLIGKLTGQPFILLVMLTGHIQSY